MAKTKVTYSLTFERDGDFPSEYNLRSGIEVMQHALIAAGGKAFEGPEIVPNTRFIFLDARVYALQLVEKVTVTEKQLDVHVAKDLTVEVTYAHEQEQGTR